MTTFLRVLHTKPEEKGSALRNALTQASLGYSVVGVVFERDASALRAIPGSPFSYWVSEDVRRSSLVNARSNVMNARSSKVYRPPTTLGLFAHGGRRTNGGGPFTGSPSPREAHSRGTTRPSTPR